MPKGYLIAHINIHDKKGFEKFREMSLPIISKYEGKALIRNPNPDLREGSNSGLVIVLEFASLDHAKRFYESEGYTLAKQVRDKKRHRCLKRLQNKNKKMWGRFGVALGSPWGHFGVTLG